MGVRRERPEDGVSAGQRVQGELTVNGSAAGPGHGDTAEDSYLEPQVKQRQP